MKTVSNYIISKVYFLSFACYKGCIIDTMQPSLATRRLSFTSASQVKALKKPKIEPPQCVKHVVKHSSKNSSSPKQQTGTRANVTIDKLKGSSQRPSGHISYVMNKNIHEHLKLKYVYIYIEKKRISMECIQCREYSYNRSPLTYILLHPFQFYPLYTLIIKHACFCVFFLKSYVHFLFHPSLKPPKL